MDDKRLVKTSKYLARHLRHEPQRLGVSLDVHGWVGVDALLSACAAQSFRLTLDELREVVECNDKRRFSFDATGTRIRANQGHSVDIDLNLRCSVPPFVLFHGTGRQSLDSIMSDGLRKMGRHHVHLSVDAATALRVGGRHGSGVVLQVAANDMCERGYEFFVSANDVWLTLEVPATFLAPRWDSSVNDG
ncbi:MAG: RNA 2'-phosphotransferase [Solirubrobacterales bacterium]